MGAGVTRKTCMLKFLVVDVPSAYNVILGRLTVNAFQAVISTYHMKIKFPTPGGVGEVQGDPSNLGSVTWRPCVRDKREPPMKLTRGFPPAKKERIHAQKKPPREQGGQPKSNPQRNY
ncbi:UNVERIFIED_CONTAM: hypothetical protein Slati_4446400 [Sesamum latifolium]